MKKQPYCRFPIAVQPHLKLGASTILISIAIGVALGIGFVLILTSLS